MTGDEMERAIEFLLNSQARLTADVQELKGIQAQTSRDVSALASSVSELSGMIVSLAESGARIEAEVSESRQEVREGFAQMKVRMDRFEAQAESDRQEIREAINNLILANEVTRDLAERVARLEIQNSDRVDALNERVTDLESKLS